MRSMTNHLSPLHQLRRATTPWISERKREAAKSRAEEEWDTQKLYRKLRAILNKFTQQKFQSLAEQALKLEINTEERLKGCIDMIYTMVCKYC